MTQPCPGWLEIAAFRLARHHLLDGGRSDPVTICRDICGAQAQIMPAAYLQLWTRNHSLTRAEIEDALWKERTLVKTHLMRQTLHLIPASEFPLYISALKSSRAADALRIMARCGIGREEADDLSGLIMSALAAGPMTRPAITVAVRPKVSKRVRAWMAKVWSILRLPMAEGLVCYGPGEGNEVKLVRVDQWLKKQKPVGEQAARASLLRKYLLVYGPATLQDFSRWAGVPVALVKPLRESLSRELAEIAIGKNQGLILRKDQSELEKLTPETAVRLLPLFDPYLLAHAQKDHLIGHADYKRVYRNQGWVSAVVLIEGRIAGTWSHRLNGKRVLLTVEAFKRFPKTTRGRIAEEAASLAVFLGAKAEVIFR